MPLARRSRCVRHRGHRAQGRARHHPDLHATVASHGRRALRPFHRSRIPIMTDQVETKTHLLLQVAAVREDAAHSGMSLEVWAACHKISTLQRAARRDWHVPGDQAAMSGWLLGRDNASGEEDALRPARSTNARVEASGLIRERKYHVRDRRP